MTRRAITPYVSADVIERAKAAVAALGGDVAHTSSMSDLVEHALRREVERLERNHNNGEQFPRVDGKLRTGPSTSQKR
ncbi:ParB family protein [Actinopolyspora mortivallis]|uniref:ParB-like C-terminal domain-containing protein n=1 Tax=Actinopolyspora mortivallis TaxID=33906 RepID=A0A2T0GV16_ACTMO|nr:hypothetical protein [Actinopolyspora mortivallis]PRW62944.1 hypothetical protein CEP50_12795 [Actinopolyspora mortivallis]